MVNCIVSNIELCVITLFSFLGFSMTSCHIPDKLKGSPFAYSRKIIGVIFFIVAAYVAIFRFTNIQSIDKYYIDVLNITVINILSILFSFAFIPLLGQKINTKAALVKAPIIILSSLILLLWGGVILKESDFIFTLTIIAITMTVISCVCLIVYFYKSYYKAIEGGNNYYCDGIEVKVGWILNSVHYVISVWVITSIISILGDIPAWWLIIYLIYVSFVGIYIYESFSKFMLTYDIIANTPEEPKPEEIPESETIQLSLNEEVKNQNHIKKELDKWLKAKKYCQKGVTIQTVTSNVYTNRTYLSAYINSTYKCSFKVWITGLKVEEAKRILSSDSRITMAEVADVAGFSSATTFAHAFKQAEKMSPLKWREANSRKVD